MNEQNLHIGDMKFEDDKIVVWNGDRWVQSKLFEGQGQALGTQTSFDYSSVPADYISFSVPKTQISVSWENDPLASDQSNDEQSSFWGQDVDLMVGDGFTDDFTAELWATLTDDVAYSTHFSIPVTTSVLRINQQSGEMLVNIHTDGTFEYGPSYDPDSAAKIFWETITGTNPTFLETQVKDLEHLYNVSQQLQDLYVTRYQEVLEEIISVREVLGVPKETSLHDFVKQMYDSKKQQTPDDTNALSSALKTFK